MTSPSSRSRRASAEPTRGLPTPFAEEVLDLVERIPRGRVMAYGDIAAALGSGGARAVGTVMARFGSGVPWHRVLRSDGSPPAGHEAEARRRYRTERTPMAPGGSRVDMGRARWWPEDAEPPG
ncbi:MAG TPA: MGMT family protein [Candidatus Nanopelagicales bacterium]|nr:MGMT family protein [Candidatus Nanopelagicales bacterium]